MQMKTPDTPPVPNSPQMAGCKQEPCCASFVCSTGQPPLDEYPWRLGYYDGLAWSSDLRGLQGDADPRWMWTNLFLPAGYHPQSFKPGDWIPAGFVWAVILRHNVKVVAPPQLKSDCAETEKLMGGCPPTSCSLSSFSFEVKEDDQGLYYINPITGSRVTYSLEGMDQHTLTLRRILPSGELGEYLPLPGSNRKNIPRESQSQADDLGQSER